jgi:hypothetical protein
VELLSVEASSSIEQRATLSFLGLCLGHVAVDARGGGHVEALGARMKLVVVDLDEVALVLALELGAGGAVGLVADDQVERGRPCSFCAWLMTSIEW